MAIAHEWKWEKSHLTSPVTSVEFLGPDLVLSGNGPFLTIHSATKGVLLDNKCLLPGSRIHGIRVEQNHCNLVVIFGQKVVRVVRLQGSASILNITWSVETVTDITAFPDLVWDAHWLYNEEKEPHCIAIATAHNAVWCWEWENNIKQLIAQCEEPCILYSARFFGSHLDNLILASGTVFNQILLWKVQGQKDEHNKTSVLQRLTGHEGVIFSLNLNKPGTLLSSVSDDRSIRLWKVTNLLSFESNGCVEPLLVVYGHAARVWDAKLLEMCFVSIGEDLMCNVWSYDGNILKSFKGHTGRNIWSLSVNQTEDLIATGGGDGSVRLWSLASPDQDSRSTVREACLPSSNSTDKRGSQKNKKEDHPRFVTLLDQSSLLVMTNEGCLYKYSWLPENNTNVKQDACTSVNQGDQWTLLLKDTNYSSYSVLALSPCSKIIAFGNLKGKIKLQDTAFNQPCMELEAYSGKVHNLLWSCQHSPQHLFSCGPDGQITWWNIRYNDGEPLLEVTPVCLFVLPPSKQRWASAIEIFSNGKESWTTESVVVVCGDRKGSLHLFDPKDADPEKPITPAHSLPLIHGKAGVSHLCVHDNTMYSAGRDGVYRQLRVHRKTLQVVDTKKVFKGFDWVERLIFTNNGDLLVAGFHAAYFVLWSVQRNELLWRVMCGGAHRVWDLALQQSDVTITAVVLSFIKDSTIYTHKISFPSEVKKSVLKPAFHGREATCICYIDSLVGQKDEISDIFATGSEDTNIKLMISNRSTGVTLPVFTAHGHISSVRALSVTKRPLTQLQPSAINVKTQGHLLFSGGGRASLKCWRVDLSVINLNSDGRHGDKMPSSPMVFLAEYSFHFSNHRRKRKKHDLQSLSEIRFMSLTSLSAAELIDQSTSDQLIGSCQSLYFVMAGCSDGFVRIFAFDEQQNKFSLLAQSQYLKRCVLTVSHVTDFLASGRPLVMLFAGDTAGRISCWDVTALLLNHIKECSVSTCEVSENEYRNDIAVEKDSVWDGKPATKAREDRLFDANVNSVSTRKGDTAPESVDTCHAKENATANSHPVNILSKTFCKGRVTEDCDGKGNVTNVEMNNKRTESSKFADIQPSTENKDPLNIVQAGLANLNHAKERTAVTYEMPDRSRTQEPQDDTIFTPDEQSGFSCLPLAGIFLVHPSHVFGAHQSGVNAITLTKTQVPGQYLLVSGGDDSALYAAQFNLMLDSANVTKVHVTCEVSEASAHTSSVTGVKALENGLVISSSVDQRLALWEVVRKDQEPSSSFAFRQLAVEMVDVADVQDLEILGERNDCLVAAVCGVGLQTFCLVGRS